VQGEGEKRMSQNDKRWFQQQDPDPEVAPKAKRRRFSAAYKKRILEEYDACAESGEKGALLRREGIYSSYITTWKRQQRTGELDGLKFKKRGPRTDPKEAEISRLEKENERLRERLEQAELIIEVQKKVSQILGLTETENSEKD
jgi:transposase-like protein